MTGELFVKKYWQGQTDSVDENSLLGPMTPQEESDILIVTCNLTPKGLYYIMSLD